MFSFSFENVLLCFLLYCVSLRLSSCEVVFLLKGNFTLKLYFRRWKRGQRLSFLPWKFFVLTPLLKEISHPTEIVYYFVILQQGKGRGLLILVNLIYLASYNNYFQTPHTSIGKGKKLFRFITKIGWLIYFNWGVRPKNCYGRKLSLCPLFHLIKYTFPVMFPFKKCADLAFPKKM